MEEQYDKLLNVYKVNYNDYISKSKELQKHVDNFSHINFETPGFIPYPDLNDPEFNKKITLKKEFNKYKSSLPNLKKDFDEIISDESYSDQFMLTNNQKFVQSYLNPLTPYNGLLLYHGVGLGKSCSAVSIAENYYKIYKKKILIIMNSNLFESFKKHIFDINKYDIFKNISNQCTGTTYPDMIINKNLQLTESDETYTYLNKKIDKIIKSRYEFKGFYEIAKDIENIEKKWKNKPTLKTEEEKEKNIEEEINAEYGNRLIIIDEAHNLRVDSKKKSKDYNIKNKNDKISSEKIEKMIKIVKNTKLLLLTATPMFNSGEEILWLLNLLLSNDKKAIMVKDSIFEANGDLKKSGEQILIDKCRGYVSFMRGENPFKFPFRLFPSINNDKYLLKKEKYNISYLEIVGRKMSKSQINLTKLYTNEEIINTELSDPDNSMDDGDDMDRRNNLQILLQISNIAYPYKKNSTDGYSRNGWNANFEQDSDKKWQYINRENQFLKYDGLEEWSPKIKGIIDRILNSQGIVFVYSRYIYSGINPLIVALEHIGFTNNDSKQNRFTKNIDIENKHNEIKKKYIVISNIFSRRNIEKLIEQSKSDKNKDAGLIKVIIVTSIASEGIDFKNIREVHLMEPWFNYNKAEQIIGRAVRYNSHISLPKERRNVTIYFWASISDSFPSVDIRIYRIIEKKQSVIFKIERILQENSIDCSLNKPLLSFPINLLNIKFDIITSQNNIIKDYAVGDRDYSTTCNFQKCKIQCRNDINNDTNIDSSTFKKYFIKNDISHAKQEVAKIYIDNISYDFNEIHNIVGIDHETLSYALDEMLKEKTILYNKKLKSGWLIYRSNLYIFQSDKLSDTKIIINSRSNNQSLRKKINLNYIKIAEKEKSINYKIIPINTIILNKYSEKLRLIETIKDKIKNIEHLIIDNIVDSLSLSEFIECMSYIKNGVQIHDHLYDSIKNIYVDKSKNYIWVYHDNMYYKYDSVKNIYLPTNDIDKNIITLFEQKLQIINPENVMGFRMWNHEQNKSIFKIKTKSKSKGYICQSSGATKISDLLENIKKYHKDLPELHFKRDILCLIYEIVLRNSKKNLFQRPILTKKNLK